MERRRDEGRRGVRRVADDAPRAGFLIFISLELRGSQCMTSQNFGAVVFAGSYFGSARRA